MSQHQAFQFTPPEPETYIATRTFDLGNTGFKAIEGQPVLYDGTMLTLPGQPPIALPGLRGAIRIGWLVKANNYDPHDQTSKIPRPAGIQVRSAEGGNPMEPPKKQQIGTDSVEAEERTVMSARQHAQATRQRNLTNYRREDIRTGAENRAVLPGEASYVIEEQDGRPVRNLTTPAKSDTNVMQASSAISRANSVKVQPGEAPTREQIMAAMTPEEQVSYLQELAQRRAINDPQGAQHLMAQAAEIHARVVGHVQAPGVSQSEGFTVTGSVGGGTEIADLGGTGGATQEQVQVIEEGGIKFTTTNGPTKGVRLVDAPKVVEAPAAQVPVPAAPAVPVNDNLCRQIAKAVCPDFPDNYVFTDPIRKKIARLQADFDDRPDIIRAVAAAESDMTVKQRLVEEFPEAFA